MIISDIIINPSSKINAKVELYQGSTLVTTCTCNDRLQELTVERIGESNKFFGFGIIHKLNIMLIDLDRSLEITNDYSFKVSFGVNEDFVRPYPTFYISAVERDETTNTISIVAYDILNKLDDFTIADLNLNATYTYMNLASKCALKIGLNSVGKKGFVPEDKSFDTVISAANPANFDGTEKLRAIVTNIAEATQSIYYIDRGNSLNFRKLNKDEAAALTVTKEDCYNLTSGEKITLGAICHVTELGDNVIAGSGTTQYVRNNPLWELRTDLPTLLENAVLYNGGLTIDQFYCDWGGNFLLEPGDKINFVAEDNSLLTAYLLHDTVKFYGILEENTQWTYEAANETAANPISLGEKLNQTYARVDKQSKEIAIVASETSANREEIAALNITTGEINASVADLNTKTATLETNLGETNTNVNQLTTDLGTLSTDLTTLGGKVDQNTTDLGTLGGKVDQNTSDLGTLNTDLTTLNGTVTTHTTEIGELKVTDTEINAKVTEVTTKAATLESSLGDTNAKVTENTTAIGELNVTTGEISASVSSVTDRTTELETKTTNLDGSLTTLSGKVTTNETKIGELVATTESITASVSSVADRTTELETTTTALDGTVTSLSEKVTTNETKIGELNVTTNEISASVASLESSTTELSDSLADTDSKVETNTSDIASLKVTTEGITASVESLESTTESLTTKDGELEESITINATAIGELQVSTEEITASVGELQTTTDNLTGEVTSNKENIASLQITTEGISTSVSSLETNLNSKLDGLDESFESLAQEVSTKVTAQDIEVAITEERQKGAEKVTTSTGFTFDSEGLTITKSDSAISTNINEDGLSVYKYNEEVLTADNTGVQAQNLHATTYLIIGNNTYFADFTGTDGRARAGCFWTGK